MRTFTFIFIISIALLQLNCGTEDNTYRSISQDSDKLVDLAAKRQLNLSPHKLNALEKKLNDLNFTCLDEDSCPDNIGIIFSHSTKLAHRKLSIKPCTGFLISEDLVATATKCIPKLLIYDSKNKTACGENLAIRFTQSSEKESIFKCEEILNNKLPIGDKNNPNTDDVTKATLNYTFFRIKPTGRKPLKISTEGMTHNMKINIVGISADLEQKNTSLFTQTCKTKLNTLINPESTTRWSKEIIGHGCFSVEGTLGAPVLNSKLEAVGLFQHELDSQEIIEKIIKSLKGFKPKPVHKIKILKSRISNLSCAQLPLKDSRQPRQCF